jgi:hypothetical protein
MGGAARSRTACLHFIVPPLNPVAVTLADRCTGRDGRAATSRAYRTTCVVEYCRGAVRRIDFQFLTPFLLPIVMLGAALALLSVP